MLIACTNMAFGQVTISTSDLVGTKWQLTEDYESHSNEYYEFTKDAFIWHCYDGDSIFYPYYIVNTKPDDFILTKVGLIAKGRYFVKRFNNGEYNCHTIMSFDKTTGKMVLKRVYPTNVIGPDTFTFILKK